MTRTPIVWQVRFLRGMSSIALMVGLIVLSSCAGINRVDADRILGQWQYNEESIMEIYKQDGQK